MPTGAVWYFDVARRRLTPACAVAVCSVLALSPVVHAETLTQALSSAYANNPRLMSERARLRATDETLARAQSGYRPTINGVIDYTWKNTASKPAGADGTSLTRSYSVNASQPIFSGGQVVSAVSEADANIRAEREVLRSVEQQVLQDAVTAYMDVIRDRATLDVQQKNVGVLQSELKQVKARFDVGEVTRTDVEQARASMSSAQASLEASRASLRSSSARYALVMGHTNDGLRDPAPPNKLLPRNLNDAVATAMASQPAVVQAAYLERASQNEIRRLTGQLLPQVTLNGQLSAVDESGAVSADVNSASVTGHVNVPIYEAGDIRAQIRQQKETRQALLQNVEQARIQAQSDVISAWAVLDASRAQAIANQQQVESSRIALEGVRAELQVGQRTEVDVLNAQQTLNNASVLLISTKHDIVVNSYRVLQVMGRLTVDVLGIGVAQYDTERHYNDTNGSWWQTSVSHEVGYAGVAEDQ